MRLISEASRTNRLVTLAAVLLFVSCSGLPGQATPIEPGQLPACQTPQPAPTLSATDTSAIGTIKATYESIVGETTQSNAETNKTISDALARGDGKTAQTAVKQRLAGPTPASDFLRNTIFPPPIVADSGTLLTALQDQRVADQAFVAAGTDSAVRATNHQRVVHIIVLENALNQFRSDLGLAPLPCPYY